MNAVKIVLLSLALGLGGCAGLVAHPTYPLLSAEQQQLLNGNAQPGPAAADSNGSRTNSNAHDLPKTGRAINPGTPDSIPWPLEFLAKLASGFALEPVLSWPSGL